jgi:calcineurin-like phosphoesterase family protein
MTRYIISDLHLDHANIIKYCDRPFDDVDAMNDALIENWNAVVEPDDTVLYLGDFGWWGVENIISLYEQLNGEMVCVRGNHDEFEADEVPFPVVESCTISHGGVEFYCEHHPIDVPDGANWWHLHGHHHNNDTETYPFIDPGARRVNVSCELLDYTPVSMDDIVASVKRGERFDCVVDANVAANVLDADAEADDR